MRNKIKTAQLGAPWESWRFLNGRSIIPNRSAPQANATSKTNSQKTKRPRRLRIGQSHWGQWLYQHGRSIVPNRSAPETTATRKTNSQKPKDADASASGRAIGDNGSTNMVDRLSPIDQRLKPPPPARPTAKNQKTPPLTRRAEPLGTMALPYWNTPPLTRRPIRKILRSSDQRTSHRPTDFSFASDVFASSRSLAVRIASTPR